MTRVNNALVCPNDDVIYAGSECPVCMSRLGHPIRNWLCPMNPVVGGQKHEQTVYPSVQKEQPKATNSIGVDFSCDHFRAAKFGHIIIEEPRASNHENAG